MGGGAGAGGAARGRGGPRKGGGRWVGRAWRRAATLDNRREGKHRVAMKCKAVGGGRGGRGAREVGGVGKSRSKGGVGGHRRVWAKLQCCAGAAEWRAGAGRMGGGRCSSRAEGTSVRWCCAVEQASAAWLTVLPPLPRRLRRRPAGPPGAQRTVPGGWGACSPCAGARAAAAQGKRGRRERNCHTGRGWCITRPWGSETAGAASRGYQQAGTLDKGKRHKRGHCPHLQRVHRAGVEVEGKGQVGGHQRQGQRLRRPKERKQGAQGAEGQPADARKGCAQARWGEQVGKDAGPCIKPTPRLQAAPAHTHGPPAALHRPSPPGRARLGLQPLPRARPHPLPRTFKVGKHHPHHGQRHTQRVVGVRVLPPRRPRRQLRQACKQRRPCGPMSRCAGCVHARVAFMTLRESRARGAPLATSPAGRPSPFPPPSQPAPHATRHTPAPTAWPTVSRPASRPFCASTLNASPSMPQPTVTCDTPAALTLPVRAVHLCPGLVPCLLHLFPKGLKVGVVCGHDGVCGRAGAGAWRSGAA